MYQPSSPPTVPSHTGRSALIHGIFAGLVLGIIQSMILVFSYYRDIYNPYSPLIVPFSLLLWIAVFLVIGIAAGKRVGRTVAGTLAGIWSGLIGGIITAATFFTIILASIRVNEAYPGQPYFSTTAMALDLTLVIVLLLVALGIGTGLGALGGLIGQSFASASQHTSFQPYQAPQRQSDPPPQEEEMVQYQRHSDPRQVPQD